MNQLMNQKYISSEISLNNNINKRLGIFRKIFVLL
jgi:hypothetical protein